jgi:hypothetical protein
VRERDAALAQRGEYMARLERRLLAQHKALQAAARAARAPPAAAPAGVRPTPPQPDGAPCVYQALLTRAAACVPGMWARAC